MNPESGWEKGNVENKIGYLRRNELVPVPSFNDLTEENKHLLNHCETDMQREHYDDNADRFISELFEEDKARLLPLPSVPFDTALLAGFYVESDLKCEWFIFILIMVGIVPFLLYSEFYGGKYGWKKEHFLQKMKQIL